MELKRASDFLDIEKREFEQRGVFNPFINFDSKLFIHPLLLKRSEIKEFKDSEQKIKTFFAQVITLSKKYVAGSTNSPFFKAVKKLFNFPEGEELRGIALGVSRDGTRGIGLTGKVALECVNSIKEFVDADIDDPYLIYLINIFQDNIGVDKTSDMLCTILLEDILNYSQRMYIDMGYILDENNLYYSPKLEKKFNVPIRENGLPLIILPESILAEIPLVFSIEDISYAVSINEEVKRYLGESFSEVMENFKILSKLEIKNILLSSKSLVKELVEEIDSKVVISYDFNKDENGIIKLVEKAIEIGENNRLNTQLLGQNLFENVKTMINHFKFLIESKGLYKELYNEGWSVKNEDASHRLFYAIATTFKFMGEFDISFEHFTGTGKVEFKFYKDGQVVLVEFKLSKNDLKHGYTKQLTKYMEEEPTDKGIFVIIEVEGGKDTSEFLTEVSPISANKPIIIINGKKQLSPSNL